MISCKTCGVDSNFVRYCDDFNQAHGGAVGTLFGVTVQECITECAENYADCAIAEHHPGSTVFPGDSRTICFLWAADAPECNWGGAGMAANNPGSTMIRCGIGGSGADGGGAGGGGTAACGNSGMNCGKP